MNDLGLEQLQSWMMPQSHLFIQTLSEQTILDYHNQNKYSTAFSRTNKNTNRFSIKLGNWVQTDQQLK